MQENESIFIIYDTKEIKNKVDWERIVFDSI